MLVTEFQSWCIYFECWCPTPMWKYHLCWWQNTRHHHRKIVTKTFCHQHRSILNVMTHKLWDTLWKQGNRNVSKTRYIDDNIRKIRVFQTMSSSWIVLFVHPDKSIFKKNNFSFQTWTMFKEVRASLLGMGRNGTRLFTAMWILRSRYLSRRSTT